MEAAESSSRYWALATAGEAEIRERGSRFLARAVPVAHEREVEQVLDSIRHEHRNASHVCFAWRLGHPARERASDAGEPRGTAGQPMLRVLQGERVSDVLGVVVRWFGGTKLGRGGLARAYGGALQLALAQAGRREVFAYRVLALEATYSQWGVVRRLVNPPNVVLRREEFGEQAMGELAVAHDHWDAVCRALSEARIAFREASSADR